jgi:deaminated glutathione amidase
MRLTVVQMSPSHDKPQNLVQARQLVEAAISADGPDLIALPEVWSCLGGSAASKSEQAEALPDRGSDRNCGPAYEFLRDVARTYKLWVHGGSIVERASDQLFNTSVVFDADGTEVARYRKMHLFDITAPDGTGYRESATFGGGDEVVTFDFKGIRVGCAICYDVRFPELFLTLRRRGAELILLPAAFTLQTGKDHWETLIRARAIETQCWFAAPATWGQHTDAQGKSRFTYGHSLICDPWGHVLARVSDGIGWATARVDQALTRKVRADMPVLEHRKLA